MKDLSNGSIVNHILFMAAPIAFGMLTQIAYQLVDVYFVTKIGLVATAGVSVAGNVSIIVIGLTQVLGVGTAALVSHAVGRKDQEDANLTFNQSMMLSIVFGALTMTLAYVLIRPYLRSIATDAATIEAGVTFIYWVLPGFSLMFPWTVIGSALRGTGIVQPTIAIYMLSVVVNTVLAPILIAGWGTGVALGVKGAGLATSISIAIGAICLGLYFNRVERYVAVKPELMRPQLEQWRRILRVGLPAGAEFALSFLSVAVVYYVIRNFGASAQAGFGIGSRMLEIIVLPGIAIALAVGPIAGQNLGARKSERVRETFRKAALIGTTVMIMITVLLQWWPKTLVGMFNADASATSAAALFLQLRSWSFVAQCLVNTCSNMFQGLGNTVPSLISSGARFFAFSIPAVWLSVQPHFRIEQVWYLLNASVMLQATISLWLLHMEFKRRLPLVAG